MKNLIKHRKGEDSFTTWVKKRIKNNLNFICLFQGPPGIGKTYSAIRFAYDIDPTFDIKKQVVFKFRHVMRLINDEEFKKKEWKIILWDEPQTEVSNVTWQSIVNRLLNYLATTFRNQNVIFILASPYRDLLDSRTMKMVHCIFECEGVNKKKRVCIVRPKLQQYNSKLKKTYEHRLYVATGNGAYPLTRWAIKKPPEEMIKLYEEKKTEFTKELNKKIEDQLKEFDDDDDKEEVQSEFEGKKLLTPKMLEVYDCWKRGITRQIDIAKELKTEAKYVGRIEKSIRKRGHYKENFTFPLVKPSQTHDLPLKPLEGSH